jgi:hypothetical protein
MVSLLNLVVLKGAPGEVCRVPLPGQAGQAPDFIGYAALIKLKVQLEPLRKNFRNCSSGAI